MMKIFSKDVGEGDKDKVARLERRVASLRTSYADASNGINGLREAVELLTRVINSATVTGIRPDVRVDALRRVSELTGLAFEEDGGSVRLERLGREENAYTVNVTFVEEDKAPVAAPYVNRRASMEIVQ